MIWHVYKKEMIDALRDKKTILFSVIFPILFNIALVFIMDYMFFHDKKETYVIAVQEQTNPTVVSWLKEQKEFEIKLVKVPQDMMKKGEAQAAIEADQTFLDRIEKQQTPTVKIYADSSSKKGDAAVTLLSKILAEKQKQMIQQTLQAQAVNPALLQPFQVAVESIHPQDDASIMLVTMFSQMILAFGIIFVQLPVANDLFAGEKERKTMEALIMTPVNRLSIIVGKWLAIASLGIIGGLISLTTFVTAISLGTERLAKAINISKNIPFFLSSFTLGIIMFALLTASILAIISLLANTMKEGQNYATPVTMLIVFMYFPLLSLSPNELQITHFLIPFVNIFALIKQLMYGIYEPINILYVCSSCAILIAICFTLAYTMFKNSKWTLGKS